MDLQTQLGSEWHIDLIPPLAQQMLSVLLAAATQNLASQEAKAGQ